MINEKTVLICVRLPESMVEEIDELVEGTTIAGGYLDRSKFIRRAIKKELFK